MIKELKIQQLGLKKQGFILEELSCSIFLLFFFWIVKLVFNAWVALFEFSNLFLCVNCWSLDLTYDLWAVL